MERGNLDCLIAQVEPREPGLRRTDQPRRGIIMRINTTNNDKLDAELAKINGKATAHTFSAYELHHVAIAAERRLDELSLPQNARKGAIFWATSSAPVAKRYGHVRAGNSVRLERGASGNWFVTTIKSVTLFPDEGGEKHLYLTAEQDAKAVALFRKQYKIA